VVGSWDKGCSLEGVGHISEEFHRGQEVPAVVALLGHQLQETPHDLRHALSSQGPLALRKILSQLHTHTHTHTHRQTYSTVCSQTLTISVSHTHADKLIAQSVHRLSQSLSHTHTDRQTYSIGCSQ